MIFANGLIGCHAGKQRLATAAESGEKMMNDAAGQDDVVRFRHFFVEINRRAARGFAEILKLRRIFAVTVVHFYFCRDISADFLDHLGLRHQSVATECEHNAHIIIRHADRMNFVNQYRQKNMRIRHSGRIVYNERDSLSGTDDLPQRRSADRLADRRLNRGDRVRQNRIILDCQFCLDQRRVEREFRLPMTILVMILFHVQRSFASY